MTTVDLAEQLLAIGRQLQATERRLTRTSSKPELPPVLQQLLTDPMARLADMLQPLTDWPGLGRTADDSVRAAAPYRWSQHASWTLGNSPEGRPWRATDASASGDQPRGWPRLARRPDRSQHAGSHGYDVAKDKCRRGDANGLAGSARPSLTRGPSGLLSILQSNVAHPVEPAAITAPGVVRATGEISPPASDPRHPSNVWSAVAHGAPSGVPKTDEHTLYVAVENASMVSNAPDDAATALSRMAIAPRLERTPVTLNLDNDLDLPQADIRHRVERSNGVPSSR